MQQKNQFGQLLGHLVENWIPCQRPARAPIQGRYCILEPIEINKHAVKLFDVLAIDNQGESWTYLPYGPFDTISEFKDWLIKTMSDNDILLYAILDIKTQEPIGISGYLRMNPEHGVIEIGHLHFSALSKNTFKSKSKTFCCSTRRFIKIITFPFASSKLKFVKCMS